MSLNQLWATLRASWLSIVLMTLVASAVAFAVASTLPKQYSAKARVMLNIYNQDPYMFSALKRRTEDGYLNTQMRLVRDPAVTREVAEKLGWPTNPQVIEAWQQATGGTGDIAAWAGGQIAQGIAVQRLEDSSILEIYYGSTSIEAAKQIVALVRTAYIDQNLAMHVEAARRAAAWNRTQAAKALAALREAEAKRLDFMKANDIALDTPVGGLDYEQHTAALNATVARAPRPGDAAKDPVVFGLQQRLNALDTALEIEQQRGDQNPGIISLRLQRDLLAQRLSRENAVSDAGPNATSEQVGLVRQARDADYLKAKLNLLTRAPLYDKLAMLDRDVGLRTRLYQNAARHVGDFDMIAAAPSGLRVLGDVIATDEPSYPNIPVMTGVAAGTSFLLAVALAILGELARHRVRGAEDLQFFAKAPVLAVIAPSPRQRRRWRVRLPARFARGRVPTPA